MRKFALYVFSGCSAAAADVGAYFLLLHLGAWYIAANIVGGVLGFFVAFLMNKFVVFQQKEHFMRHLKRYIAVDIVNLAIITGLLYLMVDMGGIDEGMAKFLALLPMVFWNFFVYKFVVYV